MDFELDNETMVSAGLAVIEGLAVLWMMKYSGASFAWRIIAAIVSMIAGFFASKFVLSR